MLLFVKRQHTKLPFQHMLIDRQEAHSSMAQALKTTYAEFDTRAVKRPTLLPGGDRVIVQDPTTKLWSLTGSVLQPAEDGLSYSISTDAGQEIRRGIKLLRKLDPPKSVPPNSPPPHLQLRLLRLLFCPRLLARASSHPPSLLRPSSEASTSIPGHQTFFENPVYPFYHAICLWVVGCGHVVGDTEEGTELLPQP